MALNALLSLREHNKKIEGNRVCFFPMVRFRFGRSCYLILNIMYVLIEVGFCFVAVFVDAFKLIFRSQDDCFFNKRIYCKKNSY